MEPKSKLSPAESWFKQHWRPFMAWQYFAICMFDFMIAPIFFAWFSYITKTSMQQWVPLTLQGGGMYHLAMGAIIGITSYGKSQEKINGVTPVPPYSPNQNYSQPQMMQPSSRQSYQSTPTQFTPKPRQTSAVVQTSQDDEL